DGGVQPDGASAVADTDGILPGEQEALAAAQLLHDHDLEVCKEPVVELDNDAVVGQGAHVRCFRRWPDRRPRERIAVDPSLVSTGSAIIAVSVADGKRNAPSVLFVTRSG